MPTYEYACKSCGEHLEVVQSFKDDPLTTCAVCGGALRKVFGSIGIAFKGSGFYKTDSRSSSKPAAKSDSGAKSESSKTESSKTEPSKTEPSKTESSKTESSKSGSSGSSSSSSSSSGTSSGAAAS